MEPIKRTYLLADRLYPQVCVDQAIAEFAALCVIRRDHVEGGTKLTITVLPEAPNETPEEFMNFLLCGSLEMLLS
jgi:hypothetical protein